MIGKGRDTMKKLTYLVAPLAAFTLALAGCPSPNPADTGPGDTGTVDTGTDSAVNEAGADAEDTPVVTDGTDAPIGGNDCTTYCTQIMTNCTGANVQYTDMADCMAYCAQAMWPAGTPGEAAGNTLACRIYHGGAPAAGMPDVHCPHAGPSGAAVCGTVNFRTDMAATYTRVDRMGMPAVSTALVPSAPRTPTTTPILRVTCRSRATSSRRSPVFTARSMQTSTRCISRRAR